MDSMWYLHIFTTENKSVLEDNLYIYIYKNILTYVRFFPLQPFGGIWVGVSTTQELEQKEVQTDAPRQEWESRGKQPALQPTDAFSWELWKHPFFSGTWEPGKLMKIGNLHQFLHTFLLGKNILSPLSYFIVLVSLGCLRVHLHGIHLGDANRRFFSGIPFLFLVLTMMGGSFFLVNAFCMMDFGAVYMP